MDKGKLKMRAREVVKELKRILLDPGIELDYSNPQE